MKKLIPITITAAALFLSACGLKDVVGPNANGTTNSDSYQPVIKGSNWKYVLHVVNSPDTDLSMTMTGDISTINGATFYKCTETAQGSSYDGYFGKKGNIYLLHSIDDGTDEAYLDDSKPAGAIFTNATTDNSNPGVPVQYKVTILEKDISKTINSKTFKNVIHTRTELQYDTGTGFQTSDVTEYFIAKGVGIVEIDSYFLGKVIISQTITGYNIK